MKLIKTFFNNSMILIRKVFLISIISVIASALAAVLSAGTAYAESANTKKALDQLFKDIDRLKPVLTERATMPHTLQ